MHFSSRLSTNTETSMLSKNTLNMESASKNPMRVKRINKSHIFTSFFGHFWPWFSIPQTQMAHIKQGVELNSRKKFSQIYPNLTFKWGILTTKKCVSCAWIFSRMANTSFYQPFVCLIWFSISQIGGVCTFVLGRVCGSWMVGVRWGGGTEREAKQKDETPLGICAFIGA